MAQVSDDFFLYHKMKPLILVGLLAVNICEVASSTSNIFLQASLNNIQNLRLHNQKVQNIKSRCKYPLTRLVATGSLGPSDWGRKIISTLVTFFDILCSVCRVFGAAIIGFCSMLPIGLVVGFLGPDYLEVKLFHSIKTGLFWGNVSAYYFGGRSVVRELRGKDDTWNVIFGALLAGVYSNHHRTFKDASLGCFYSVALSGALDGLLNQRKSQTVPVPSKKRVASVLKNSEKETG